MLTIPFAAKLGTTLGAALDGVVHGVLPKTAIGTLLSEVHLAPLTKVYRLAHVTGSGTNAIGDGAVIWGGWDTIGPLGRLPWDDNAPWWRVAKQYL